MGGVVARLVFILRSECFRSTARIVVGRWPSASGVRRSRLLEFFAALPVCLIGIKAPPSAHYWRHELQTLRVRHPSYVKAYVSVTTTMPMILPRYAKR
jgi:transposase